MINAVSVVLCRVVTACSPLRREFCCMPLPAFAVTAIPPTRPAADWRFYSGCLHTHSPRWATFAVVLSLAPAGLGSFDVGC